MKSDASRKTTGVFAASGRRPVCVTLPPRLDANGGFAPVVYFFFFFGVPLIGPPSNALIGHNFEGTCCSFMMAASFATTSGCSAATFCDSVGSAARS